MSLGMVDVSDFLKSLGFDKYIPMFLEHCIDLKTLMHMTDSELEELELDFGMAEDEINTFRHNVVEIRKEALSDFLGTFEFKHYTLPLLEYDTTLGTLISMDEADLDALGIKIQMGQDDITTFKYHVHEEKKITAILIRKKWLTELHSSITQSRQEMVQLARTTFTNYFTSSKHCDLYNLIERNDELFLGIMIYELEFSEEILPSDPQQTVGQFISRLFDVTYTHWEQRLQNVYYMNMSFWVEWTTDDDLSYYVNPDTHEALWDTEIDLKKKKHCCLIITNKAEDYETKRKLHWHAFGWKWICTYCETTNSPSLESECSNSNCNKWRNIYEVIGERMLSIPENATFVVRALRVLRRESQRKAAPLSENVVSSVLIAMKKHPDSILINSTACAVLRNFAWGTEQHKRIMGKTNAIEAIVTTMLNHPMIPSIQEKACEAIRNITIDDANERRAIQVGAIQRVTEAMKKHKGSPTIQEKAMQALYNLTDKENHKKVAIESQAIECLDEIMKRYPDFPMLRQLAFTVKNHLSPDNSLWRICTKPSQ